MPRARASEELDLGLLPGDSEVLFEVHPEHYSDKSKLAKWLVILVLTTFGLTLTLILGKGFTQLPQVTRHHPSASRWNATGAQTQPTLMDRSLSGQVDLGQLNDYISRIIKEKLAVELRSSPQGLGAQQPPGHMDDLDAKRLNETQDDLSALRQQLDKNKVSHDEAIQSVDKGLNDRAAELSGLSADLAKIREDITILSQITQRHQATGAATAQTIQRLQDDSSRLDQGVLQTGRSLQELDSKIVGISEDLASLRDSLSKLNAPSPPPPSQCEATGPLADEVTALKTTISGLETMLAQADTRPSIGPQELMSLKQEMVALQGGFEDLKKAHQEQQSGGGLALEPGPMVSSVSPEQEDRLRKQVENLVKEIVASTPLPASSPPDQSAAVTSSGAGASASSRGLQVEEVVAAVMTKLEGGFMALLNSEVVSRGGKAFLGVKDFALASAGARIVDKFTSPSFGSTMMAKISRFTGLGVDEKPPEIAISGGRKNPGDCWPMEGSQGNLTVKLIEAIVPRAITLEHIPKELSPVGVKSAIHRFRVWGRASEEEASSAPPVLLGPPQGQTPFEYNVDSVMSAQQFPLPPPRGQPPIRVVTLEVLSNHGHANYTCIYRFRVHNEESTHPVFPRSETRGVV